MRRPTWVSQRWHHLQGPTEPLRSQATRRRLNLCRHSGTRAARPSLCRAGKGARSAVQMETRLGMGVSRQTLAQGEEPSPEGTCACFTIANVRPRRTSPAARKRRSPSSKPTAQRRIGHAFASCATSSRTRSFTPLNRTTAWTGVNVG